MDYKKIVEPLLKDADIRIDGDNLYDIRIYNQDFYKRVLKNGSMGLGESYMDGWWDCIQLDKFFYRILSVDLGSRVRHNWKMALRFAGNVVFNPQRKSKAFKIGKRHYNLGNNLYKAMLDEHLTYTCGYWKEADSLGVAQETKLDLVCQKIGLKPGQKVLDIGCGWGSFAKYAAERYKAEVVGITVSTEQVELARKRTTGLLVEIKLQDYRDIDGIYDHIVSLGMFEHVGEKNYRTYMRVIHKHLRDGGLFLLHTIGGNKSAKTTDPWIERYIFPGSMLPSVAQIGSSIEGLFVMEDWHNFSADYDKTLMAWYRNFENNWGKIKSNYDQRFYRMWKYYLLACAGSFRARENQLWQIILSKKGVQGGYASIR